MKRYEYALFNDYMSPYWKKWRSEAPAPLEPWLFNEPLVVFGSAIEASSKMLELAEYRTAVDGDVGLRILQREIVIGDWQ
jgi:hypothetical protein